MSTDVQGGLLLILHGESFLCRLNVADLRSSSRVADKAGLVAQDWRCALVVELSTSA